jgi:hypothetical protein
MRTDGTAAGWISRPRSHSPTGPYHLATRYQPLIYSSSPLRIGWLGGAYCLALLVRIIQAVLLFR